MIHQSTRSMRFAPLLLAFFLAACASGRDGASSLSSQQQGAAPGQGNYKVGKPYQINGIWYYPKEDFSYDETGVASWYGDDFHQRQTANGETFNKFELTAAHPTLPMPSLARVTNLENGRSIVVRINDRGPFSGARVIDVTQRAAQLLGFEKQGTAKVRVQVLADESKAIADAMRRYGGPAPGGATPPDESAMAMAQVSPNARVEGVQSQALPPIASSSGGVTTYRLDSGPATPAPLPQTRAEVKAAMATIKPVPEARTLMVPERTQLYIQAGAFSHYENAMAMQKKLSRLGRTIISEVEVKGVKLYRVRLGPIPDVATADKVLPRVKSIGATAARTVVDTQSN